MKIKVIRSYPADGQDSIYHLIGREFEIVPYSEFDRDVRTEMKELGEVAVKDDNGHQYILNKSEYEVVQ